MRHLRPDWIFQCLLALVMVAGIAMCTFVVAVFLVAAFGQIVP